MLSQLFRIVAHLVGPTSVSSLIIVVCAGVLWGGRACRDSLISGFILTVLPLLVIRVSSRISQLTWCYEDLVALMANETAECFHLPNLPTVNTRHSKSG